MIMAEGYKHSYLNVDGVKTHYIEAGRGDTFVLVHGGKPASCAELNYGYVVGPLGEHFHAVAPDVIGFGETAPRGPQDYPSEAQGAHLVRFIEALNVGPVFLAGNSHGGYLVQYVAHERPNLVKKLVIINSMNGTFPHASLPDEEKKKSVYQPGGHQWAEKTTMENIRAEMKEFYAHKDLVTEDRVKLEYDTYMRTYEYHDKRARARWYYEGSKTSDLSYKGKNIAEWAGQLKMPVLLTWSEPGSKVKWGVSYFFKIPCCEMHIFPWSGHHVQSDQQDRWIQVVTDFLKNKPARPLS